MLSSPSSRLPRRRGRREDGEDNIRRWSEPWAEVVGGSSGEWSSDRRRVEVVPCGGSGLLRRVVWWGV